MDFYEEQFVYNQDPNLGYEIFGTEYSEYGYGNSDAPLPTPDKNWVDPMKVNRAYLEKIKKDCIQKEFLSLKKEGIFLMEVLVERIGLNSDVIEKHVSEDSEGLEFMTFVKLLKFPFLEVKENFSDGQPTTSDFFPSYKGLFQTINTSARSRRETFQSEGIDEDDLEEKDSGSEGSSESSSRSKLGETEETSKDSEIVERKTYEVMKGKSVLFSMTGQEMITTLLKQIISVKVMNCDLSEGENRVESVTLGTSSFRAPETFSQSVIQSIKPDTILPFLVTEIENHPLLDLEGQPVGEVFVNISLTSFGTAIVNCVREENGEGYNFEHTLALRCFKSVPVPPPTDLFAVNPRLAKRILEMGVPPLRFRTSAQILETCVTSNFIEPDAEERKLALPNDCHWMSLVRDVMPKQESVCTTISELMLRKKEEEIEELCKEHDKICRDLKMKMDLGFDDKRSLYDRLEEMQIQTGVAILDTNNPFVEEAETEPREEPAEGRYSDRKESQSSGGSPRYKSSLRSGSARS